MQRVRTQKRLDSWGPSSSDKQSRTSKGYFFFHENDGNTNHFDMTFITTKIDEVIVIVGIVSIEIKVEWSVATKTTI